jgi:hypothetical protein
MAIDSILRGLALKTDDADGPGAEFGLIKRSLTAWLAKPASGDRFVWYNPDGSARLWRHGRGDLLTVTSLGNVGIGTPDPATKLKEDASHQQHQGFVAEELPATVATPDRQGFSPLAIIAVLTKVVQRQQQQIMGLQEEIVRIKDMASRTSVVRETQVL